MKLSDVIANMILEMLEESDGHAEIQRNELAGRVGCVPSQINYVLTSRFTPEQGYIVESRRGGGGYIRITRANYSGQPAVMHVVNSIGFQLDEASCRNIVNNMCYQQMLSMEEAALICAALTDSCYREVPPTVRDSIRAAQFKQMLLATLMG